MVEIVAVLILATVGLVVFGVAFSRYLRNRLQKW